LEPLDDEKDGKISRLVDIQLLPRDVTQASKGLVIECIVRSHPKYSEFNRKDGTTGSLTQFMVGESKTNTETRVALWDYRGRDLMKIPLHSKLTLLNVKSKILPQGGMEFHGDSGTNFEVIEIGETVASPKDEEITLIGKILTLGLRRTAKSGSLLVQALLISTQYKLFNLILLGKAAEHAAILRPDSMIELTGKKVEDLKVICENPQQIRETSDVSNIGDVEISKIDLLQM
jgi:hypothetical protein